MRIDGASPGDVQFVAERMRARDVAEFMAISAAEDREQLVAMLVDRYAARSDVICASLGHTPVAVGAMVEARPNVVTLLFFATDRFPTIALELTRFIRQRLFPTYRAAGVHRIECVSIDGYEETHRWIQILGLKREAEFPGYGHSNGNCYFWKQDDGSFRRVSAQPKDTTNGK